MVAKTVDLRKAYKQLQLSEAVCGDAYLSVWCPTSKSVHISQSLVLPFGSRPSVQAFYRSSHCVGAKLLLDLRWSLFYDDYVIVSSKDEVSHLSMVLDSFFALVHRQTSKKKGSPFNATARALGVEICRLVQSEQHQIAQGRTCVQHRSINFQWGCNCMHLHTDASFEQGEGGLGAVLFNSGGLLLQWFAEP